MGLEAELYAGNIVAFVEEIFTRQGSTAYLGEPVTISEHMLQSAILAEEAGSDELTIVATLLHDIGHFASAFGSFSLHDSQDRYHEVAGARIIEALLPSAVVDCVRYHVAAKRYLCAVEPAYFDRLSPASVHSLRLQGGPMANDEVERFSLRPGLDRIVQVRRFDDAAKVPNAVTRDFAYYAPLMQALVDEHATTAR